MKRHLFFLFILFASLKTVVLKAQILPCDANEILIEDNCVFNSYSSNFSTQTVSSTLSPNCGNYINGGQWFHITFPSQGQSILIDFESSDINFQPELATYLGDCNSLTLLDCFDGNNLGIDLEIIIDDGCGFNLTGEDMWIFVWNANGSINVNFDLCITNYQGEATDTDVSCYGLPMAGNYCCDAPVFNLCDLDNFCSETGGLFQGDTPAAFCGDLENNQWIGFIAEDNMIEIEIEVGTCLLQNGLQAQIYQTNDCNFFIPVSPCYNNAIPNSIVTVSTGLTPGNVYYIMIDGWGADICDFELNVVDGLATIDVPQSNDTICPGSDLTLNVVTTGAGIANIYWDTDPTLDVSDAMNPIASPTSNTIYYMHIEGTSCDTLLEVPINVYPQTLGVTWDVDNTICEGEMLDITFNFPNNDNYSIEIIDGVTPVTLNAVTDGYIYSTTTLNANTSLEFVSFMDENGCTQDINLVENINVYPSWDSLNISYTCLVNGNFVADITLGSDDLSIVSGDGVLNGFHFLSNPIANNTTSTIQIVDSNNCITRSFELNHLCACSDDFEVSIDVVAELECNGDATAQLNTSTVSGNGTLSYLWNNNMTTSQINNLSAGVYTVTVTDEALCTTMDTITIEEIVPMSFNISFVEPLCEGEQNGMITFENISGGLTPYEYSIDGDNFYSDSIYENLQSGSYSAMVVDQNGCMVSQEIDLGSPTPFYISLSGNTEIQLGETINLALESTNPIDSINWSTNYYSNCVDCDNYVIEPTSTGTYNVEAWDENGCHATSQIFVRLFNAETIFVPTVFTPNFDGINDYLSVFCGQSVRSISQYKIFNRWGELLYHTEGMKTNDLNSGWDGRYKNVNMDQGVFLYVVEVELKTGEKVIYSGDFTLIR